MSIINNVLKDLEERSSRFTPLEVATVGGPSLAKRNPLPINRIALVVALTGVALLSWIYLENNRVEPVAEIVDRVAIAEPIKESMVVAVVEPPVVEPVVTGNEIIGLQIHEGEAVMSLEFSLTDKVVSYLKERGESRFIYHLKDVQSQILAPVLNDNRWIRQLSIVSRDQGVDINFQTATDILVETSQKQQAGEHTWVISLRKSAPVQIPVSAEAKPVVGETIQQAPAVEQAPVEEKVVRVDIKSTNPNARADSQIQYAIELMQSNRSRDAEALLLSLLGGSEDIAARLQLVGLYNREQRAEQLSKLIRESMALHPDQAIFKTEYARSLFTMGAYHSVIDIFSDAPLSGRGQHSLLAASYQRLDQHANAVKHYQLALAEDERDVKNWIGLAISQEHSSAFGDALNSYQTAAKLGGLNGRLQSFVEKRIRTLDKVLN